MSEIDEREQHSVFPADTREAIERARKALAEWKVHPETREVIRRLLVALEAAASQIRESRRSMRQALRVSVPSQTHTGGCTRGL